MRTMRTCVVALATTAAMALAVLAQEPRWFSAWAAAHNVGRVVAGLNGDSVRLIVRPTLSGRSLRLKFTNIRGEEAAVFSAAFVGVSGPGATVVTGTNRQLTFNRAGSLTLGPDESAWSDPISFDVKAFQRLAVSLDVASASDVSMDTLALVTTYLAAGHHAAETSADAFAPIPPNAPDSTDHEYPMYWLAAVDVLSSAVGTIVAVGDSWIGAVGPSMTRASRLSRIRVRRRRASECGRIPSDGSVPRSGAVRCISRQTVRQVVGERAT